MPNFITRSLASLAHTLEWPLFLLASKIWVALDEDFESPRGFWSFGIRRCQREIEVHGFGVFVAIYPEPQVGSTQRLRRDWLAVLTRAFGWDFSIGRDDPRNGLFEVAFERLGERSFQVYGLGLYVIASPLRLSRR